MGKDVCIKAGTFCPVCKSIPLADCWHSAGEFNSGNVSYRFDTLTARITELEAENVRLRDVVSECEGQFAEYSDQEDMAAMADLCAATLNKETEAGS